MDRSEFLKQAKAKLKAQNEKSWVSELNFIYSYKLVLRVWFDTNLNTYLHHWCSIETLPIIQQQKIERGLGRYTSNDKEDFPAIIEALKKTLKENPESMVDYVEGISIWEKVEWEFTVQQFCDLIGIEGD